MTLATVVALAAIFGTVLGVPGLVFAARQQKLALAAAARQAAKDRRDEIDREVRKAVEPVHERMVYYRDRMETLEAELRNRHG